MFTNRCKRIHKWGGGGLIRRLRQIKISIFKKLVIAFFVFLLPVYLVSTLMNNWGADMVRRQVSDSFKTKMHYNLETLEQDVERVIRFQYEYLNDFDLQRLSLGEAGLTTYDISLAMRRFQSKLNLIRKSGEYVVNATVYIYPLRRKISTTEITQWQPGEEKLYNDFATRSGDSPLVPSGGRLVVRALHPTLQSTSDRTPSFMLETEISVGKIREFLRQMTSEYPDSGAALAGADWQIEHSANDDILRSLQSSIARLPRGTSDEGTTRMKLKDASYLTVYEYSRILGMSLIVQVPESAVLGPLRKFESYIWLLSFVSCAMILSFSYWVFRALHRPLRELVSAFRKVELGQRSVEIGYRGNDEFQYLYRQFNRMTDRLQTLVFEVYEHGLRTKQAELKQLQSQINPHFLYNSMFLLYRMVKADDRDNALQLAEHMGEYFRYITRKTESEVPFRQEWDHVMRYAEIQALRFSGRMSLIAPDELPEEAARVPVPQLILQPIVENAFEHAIERKLSGGEVAIGARIEDGRLVVEVADNGPGLSDEDIERLRTELSMAEETVSVTGIVNVHRRLQLKYGPEAGLRIERAGEGEEASGLRFSLMIPFEQSAPLNTKEDE